MNPLNAPAFLSVLVPIQAPPGGHVVHVYRIECDASLQWVREHADEIAGRLVGATYNALMVSATDPDPEGGVRRAYFELQRMRERAAS